MIRRGGRGPRLCYWDEVKTSAGGSSLHLDCEQGDEGTRDDAGGNVCVTVSIQGMVGNTSQEFVAGWNSAELTESAPPRSFDTLSSPSPAPSWRIP
jgi:hypothetical protein